MESPEIRKMSLADASATVSLNAAVVDVTSPMDVDRFAVLYELSALKLVAEVNSDVVAFVMAMTDGTAYENDNYRWFSARLRDFMYIDRVVVTDACRGLGIGRLLYSRICAASMQAGVRTLCAEINLEPPNRVSLRFHEKSGFVQIGTRVLGNGKRVSMQACPVTDAAGIASLGSFR